MKKINIGYKKQNHYDNTEIYIDPYKKQGNGFGWVHTCNKYQGYQITHSIIIDLKYPPKTGCCGDHFTLAENGQIYLLKGFILKPCRTINDSGDDFLATLVATILSNVECDNQYSFFRRAWIDYKISRSQGKGFLKSLIFNLIF